MKTTQCSVDGCGRGGKIVRGVCSMHYGQIWRRGEIESLPGRPSVAERLASGLVCMPSGCLEWTRGASKGYGVIQVEGKSTRTHRLAWTLANGPIPDGLHILHHCDNPPCCQTNPTPGYPDGHLFLGTIADNNADRDTKGRSGSGSVNAAKTRCPQGHDYDEANTHIDPSGNRHCRACNRINCAHYYQTRRLARVEAA